MSDTETPTKKHVPFIPDVRDRVKRAEAGVVVSDWLRSVDWPGYVGRFQLSDYGYIWVYPTDITEGFPDHFQAQLLKLLPFRNGKLRREFRDQSGEVYWSGSIAIDDLPMDFALNIDKDHGPIHLMFECGTKTNCKLIKKTREETYFELDCSDQAKAEVASGAKETAEQ